MNATKLENIYIGLALKFFIIFNLIKNFKNYTSFHFYKQIKKYIKQKDR